MMQRIQLVFERKKRGWSSTQAASFFGVSLASYSRIERGHSNGTMRFWRKVQESFNIPNYLMWDIIWPADESGRTCALYYWQDKKEEEKEDPDDGLGWQTHDGD